MNMKNIQSSKNRMHVKRLKDGTEIISKNYFDTISERRNPSYFTLLRFKPITSTPVDIS